MPGGSERASTKRSSFQEIASGALASIEAVLSHWLPNGKRQGQEYLVRNPRRADAKLGSFSINLQTGAWADFATGDKGGDLIALVAYLDGVKQAEACARLAGFLRLDVGKTPAVHTPARSKPQAATEWKAITPIPEDAPRPPSAHPKHGRPSMRWTYHDAAGAAVCHVCRFDPKRGRKQILPLTYCESPKGKREWRWQGLPEPRPLYNLHRLAESPAAAPVVVVEGEKSADAAAGLFGHCVVTTMLNGAQAPAKTDWRAFAGRTVWLWPDADEPGRACMEKVHELVRAAGVREVRTINLDLLRADGKPLPKGWDAADAVAQGWTAERMAALAGRADFFLSDTAAGRKPAEKQEGLPDWFQLTDAGLYYLGVDKNGDPQRDWICSTLRVMAHTRNEQGESWGTLLEFPDLDGKSHRWAMPNELLKSDGAELRGALLYLGLRIAPGQRTRNRLIEYLQTTKPGARARCVERTGWHGGVYVLPDRTIGEADELVIFQSATGTTSTFRERGALDEWREHVAALCAGNTRLVFAVSVGFAAMLLQIVEGESGGFHFRADSSTGKTTALRVAASVFGGPDYMRRWRSTDNGLEAVAMQYCGTLLILDELSQVDPKLAGEVAYMLANGAGKSRASRTGGLRGAASWSLLFLSSGEIGLAEHMLQVGKRARAGQEVRLVDIPADAGAGLGLFEDLHGHESGAAFARALDAAARRYYGAAAITFLSHLVAHLDKLPAMIAEARRGFVTDHLAQDASGQVHRAATRFALVSAAGEIASHFGITGWARGEATRAAETCFAAWVEARGGQGNQEDAAMLAQVRRFFELHGEARFTDWDRVSDDHAPRTMQRAGFRRTRDSETEYFLLPETFKSEVCAGFDSRAVARLLLRLGWIQGADGKASKPVSLPGLGKTRCYQFTSKVWEPDHD